MWLIKWIATRLDLNTIYVNCANWKMCLLHLPQNIYIYIYYLLC